jgi:hypothetical protein
MTQMLYRNYIVAYLDIWGSKEGTGYDIKKALESVEHHMKTIARASGINTIPGPKVKIRIFSDNISITVRECDYNAFAAIISHVTILQASLIANGFLYRGAIVFGHHYEKGSTMFGPALAYAVHLEKVANWPRVVVDVKSICYLRTLNLYTAELAMEYLRRDYDGLLFVDYLRGIYVVFKDISWTMEYMGFLSKLSEESHSAYDFITSDYISKHRIAIERSINPDSGGRPNIDVLVKYHTLAEYHNATIDSICNALANASKVIQSNPNVELNKLRHFNLSMLAGLTNSERDKVVEFVYEKITKLGQTMSLLETNKIDLKRNFPEFY